MRDVNSDRVNVNCRLFEIASQLAVSSYMNSDHMFFSQSNRRAINMYLIFLSFSISFFLLIAVYATLMPFNYHKSLRAWIDEAKIPDLLNPECNKVRI